MHKTRNVNTNTRCNYLKLVSSNSTPLPIEQPEMSSPTSFDPGEIIFLTVAMMNRLWIPQTSTIVGLLGVGNSRDNVDELTKWIAVQINTNIQDGCSADLHQLESDFRRTVDSYPEF